MAFGKKTGGRKAGTPNKLTEQSREVFKAMFDRLAPKAEQWIEQAAADDPARGADLALRLAEFHIPKLGRTEVTGKDGEPVKVVEIVSYAKDNDDGR